MRLKKRYHVALVARVGAQPQGRSPRSRVLSFASFQLSPIYAAYKSCRLCWWIAWFRPWPVSKSSASKSGCFSWLSSSGLSILQTISQSSLNFAQHNRRQGWPSRSTSPQRTHPLRYEHVRAQNVRTGHHQPNEPNKVNTHIHLRYEVDPISGPSSPSHLPRRRPHSGYLDGDSWWAWWTGWLFYGNGATNLGGVPDSFRVAWVEGRRVRVEVDARVRSRLTSPYLSKLGQ